MEEQIKYNTMVKTFGHEHLIVYGDTAKHVVPILNRIVGRKLGRWIVVKLLCIANPSTHKDDIERLANLIMAMSKTRKELFAELEGYGGDKDLFQILTIDQSYMGAGKTPTEYEDQIIEIVNLIKEGKRIKMYLHIDCRRNCYIDLLNKYKKYISGLKFYNYMGTFPYDINYNPAYHFAKENNLTCIFHCSRGNINYYRGKDIDRRLNDSHYALYKTRSTNKEKSMNFSNPQGMLDVARDTGVEVQIAHLGGYEEFDKFITDKEYEVLFNKTKQTKPDYMYSFSFQILKGCIELENVYTDTSFTCYKPLYHEMVRLLMLHPILKHKIRFGTDFPVNKTVAEMKNYLEDFKRGIGTINFDYISVHNFKKKK